MLIPILAKIRITARVAEEMAKSKRHDIVAAKGNTSLGKYIFVTRFVLPIKLFVENRIDVKKNENGIALTPTDTIEESSIGSPETMENAFFTNMPAATTSIGIKIAHMYPIIVCLYLILISRQARVYNK